MSINAKTTDEIKKGLAVCSADECHGQHTDCPYHPEVMCIRNICADALAYIQQLEAKVPKWISVKEHLPEQEQRVLFYAKGNEAVYIGLYLYTGLHGAVWFTTTTSSSKRNGGTYTATHWMPLPEPVGGL